MRKKAKKLQKIVVTLFQMVASVSWWIIFFLKDFEAVFTGWGYFVSFVVWQLKLNLIGLNV